MASDELKKGLKPQMKALMQEWEKKINNLLSHYRTLEDKGTLRTAVQEQETIKEQLDAANAILTADKKTLQELKKHALQVRKYYKYLQEDGELDTTKIKKMKVDESYYTNPEINTLLEQEIQWIIDRIDELLGLLRSGRIEAVTTEEPENLPSLIRDKLQQIYFVYAALA
ncbi:hypothetical protein KY338_05405 [Candidatus Woesearchaeota archaeon]|nr:hypothetical protein [Candidatus Woesearchaeota archaeon]MBW3006339.1 hypothetical protein [Candidatus Woesearchaeota archaeon]